MRMIIINSNVVARKNPDRHRELITWARAVGVDTKLASVWCVLIERPDGWHLHDGMRTPGTSGGMKMGANRRQLLTDYTTDILIGEPNWPGWFPDPLEVPDVPGAVVLELLAAHQTFADEITYAIRYEGNSVVWQVPA